MRKPGDAFVARPDRLKGTQEKISRSSLKKLGAYLMTERWWLLLAILLSVAGNLLALTGPMLSGLAVDAIEPGPGRVEFARVWYYAGWMILCYGVAFVCSYSLSVLMIAVSQRIVGRMRKDVFERLVDLPVGYFDTRPTGDIISRISYDIDTVNATLSHDAVQLMTTVITVTGALAMMVRISGILVLVFVVTVPLSIFLTRQITRRTRPLYRKRSRSLGELNGYAEEMVSGMETLAVYCQEEHTVKGFGEKNSQAAAACYRADYYGNMVGSCVNFVNNLSLALISVFGALLYLAGAMTIGNISSFVLYSRKFSGPINEFANIIGELQSSMAAAERIVSLLTEPAEAAGEDKDTRELAAGQGKVDCENLTFGYNPGHPVLRGLSLAARPGALVAIVGPTGAGKTTIINLLMRFYDAQGGQLWVDGQPVREVTRRSLRGTYAMVLQDTWLFSGTVFENLSYGKPGAALHDVKEAARMAMADSFIEKLPQGYDTVLTEDGSNLSKGQKQLLTIARAMLLDARILILDEATSNVDTQTEQKIQKAMRHLMKDKTCFVIAHRLSTIRNADEILVVDHGQVVEQGRHGELMERKGFYYRLYQSQFCR